MSNKHEPHFACVICAAERTFPADHLRIYLGNLWCDTCWYDQVMDIYVGDEYHELPPFIPEADQKIQILTDALNAIKLHVEMAGGQDASTTWRIADAALVGETWRGKGKRRMPRGGR